MKRLIVISILLFASCEEQPAEEEETTTSTTATTQTTVQQAQQQAQQAATPTDTNTADDSTTGSSLPDGYSALVLDNGKTITITADGSQYFLYTPTTDMTLDFSVYSEDTQIQMDVSTTTSFDDPIRTGKTSLSAGMLNLYYNATADTTYYIKITELSSEGGSPRISVAKETCTSNPDAKFTTDIMHPDDIAYIIPPGLVTAVEIKPHSYIRTLATAPEGGKVFAPATMEMVSGAFYSHDETADVYIFNLRLSCEVRIWIDHVYEPPAAIADHFSSTPGTSTGNDTLDEKFTVQAGDLIGYVQPFYDDDNNVTDRGIDLGIMNLTKKNQLANLARHAEKMPHSDCPYDYFPTSLQDNYKPMFGDNPTDLVPDVCRSANIDVVGSIRGHWYKQTAASGNYNEKLFIGSNVSENTVLFGSLASGNGPMFMDDSDTFKLPELVTDSHCYSNATYNHHVYVKVVDDETLHIVYDDSTATCPSEFPDSGYAVYIR